MPAPQCRKCKSPLGPAAATSGRCPYCGARNPVRDNRIMWVVLGMIGAYVGYLIVASLWPAIR